MVIPNYPGLIRLDIRIWTKICEKAKNSRLSLSILVCGKKIKRLSLLKLSTFITLSAEIPTYNDIKS